MVRVSCKNKKYLADDSKQIIFNETQCSKTINDERSQESVCRCNDCKLTLNTFLQVFFEITGTDERLTIRTAKLVMWVHWQHTRVTPFIPVSTFVWQPVVEMALKGDLVYIFVKIDRVVN